MDGWYLGRRYDWWLDMSDWSGVGRDRFGSADRNTRVRDSSGLAWGVTKDSKAAEDNEGSEKFRDGS